LHALELMMENRREAALRTLENKEKGLNCGSPV